MVDKNDIRYKSYSNASKKKESGEEPEEKRIDKVVKCDVVEKKTSGVGKLVSLFVPRNASDVKQDIVHDVIVPFGKRALFSIMEIVLGNGSGSYSRKRPDGVSYEHRYDSDYKSSGRYDRDYVSEKETILSIDGFKFSDRGEAESVIERMDILIDEYKIVRVTDFYDMIGRSCPYTANRYGWDRSAVSRAVVKRTWDDSGYIIKIPRAMPLD